MDKIQDEIIGEFSVFDDWLDKYDYLIELSDALPADRRGAPHRPLPDQRLPVAGLGRRTDSKGGKVYYTADSDAIITKGIIALLIRVLNGRTPQEILATGPLLHRRDRACRRTSRPRGPNGLLAMLNQMRLYALAFAKESEMRR